MSQMATLFGRKGRFIQLSRCILCPNLINVTFTSCVLHNCEGTEQMGIVVVQLVEALHCEVGGSGFNPLEGLRKIFKGHSFYPQSVASGFTQPLTAMTTKEFPWE